MKRAGGARSLAVRILAGVIGAQLLLAAGLVGVGIAFTRRQLETAFAVRLRGRLASVAALVRYAEVGNGLVFDRSLVPPEADAAHPDFFRLQRVGGGVIVSTFPAGEGLPAAGGGSWDFSYAGAPYRGLALAPLPVLDTEEDLTGPPAQLAAYYAAPRLEMEHEVVGAGVAIGATSLVLLVIAALLAAGTIRRELEPLRDLAAEAGAISPHHWKIAVAPRTAATAELAPLTAALERMLERLQSSFQRQREFLADAAHELKTPVAILKSTLQALLQRERSPAEYEAGGESALQDVERLEQLLQRMLRLARLDQNLEATGVAAPQPVDVATSCEAAVARVRPLAEARGVGVRARMLAQPRVNADAEDLEQVWINLLENAVQHSAAGAAVEIAVREDAVTVQDWGTGISAAELPHIFDRFRRGENARERPGFGLGLAIARAIVDRFGGRIEAESEPGRGTRMSVRLRG